MKACNDFQQEQPGTHTVKASLTIFKTFTDCTAAEAVEFASDYVSQALLDADDFECDMEVT